MQLSSTKVLMVSKLKNKDIKLDRDKGKLYVALKNDFDIDLNDIKSLMSLYNDAIILKNLNIRFAQLGDKLAPRGSQLKESD